MDDHISNKIRPAPSGIFVLLNLSERGRDLVPNVCAETMESYDAIHLSIKGIFKIVALSMPSSIFGQLKGLLACRCATNETHVRFKALFSVQLCKYKYNQPHGSDICNTGVHGSILST